MKVKRDGWLAWWAYMFSDSYHDGDYWGAVPRRTSLCALFWRSVLLTPLVLLCCVGAVIALAAIFGIFIVRFWRPIGITLGSVALVWGIIWLLMEWATRTEVDIPYVVQESTLYKGFKSVKGKFCPIIDFTFDGDDDPFALTEAEKEDIYYDEDLPVSGEIR